MPISYSNMNLQEWQALRDAQHYLAAIEQIMRGMPSPFREQDTERSNMTDMLRYKSAYSIDELAKMARAIMWEKKAIFDAHATSEPRGWERR